MLETETIPSLAPSTAARKRFKLATEARELSSICI
jgi:hypothetical protein